MYDASIIDFCDKIVRLEGRSGFILRAKRGDLSGVKNVWRDLRTFTDVVTLRDRPPSKGYKALLSPLIRNGNIVRELDAVDKLRRGTTATVEKVCSVEPSLRWD